MRSVNLCSWKVAVLASLGVIQGCGGDAFSVADNAETEKTKSATKTASGGAGGSSDGGSPGTPAKGGTATTPTTPVRPPSPGIGGATTQPVTPVDPPEPGTGGATTQPITPVDPTPVTPTAMPPEPPGPCSDGTKREDGLVECEGGVVHRAEAAMCESSLPRAMVYEKTELFRCTQDSDCSERPHGYCQKYPPGQIGQESSGCQYGCVADGDCADGQVCECGDPVGTCVAAPDCKTTADCAENSLCARYQFNNGCGDEVGYACLSDKDQCTTNEECGVGMGCRWSAEGRRCAGAQCAVGRPFIVQGAERLAMTEGRRDWVEGTDGTLGIDLSAEQRQLVAGAWADIGLMEHASIAAFARFSLQLLSLGAPSSLVEACNQAMVDETLHAKLAFGLASQVSGINVGPGRLPMDHVLDASDLTTIVLGTVLEGCIGETVAAIEAAQGLSTAEEPAVVATLKRIAADERRHADLAWQFVRWALTQDASLAPKIQALVTEEIAKCEPALETAPDPALARFGILSDAARQNLRRAVLREVVAPCVDALSVDGSQSLQTVPDVTLSGMNEATTAVA